MLAINLKSLLLFVVLLESSICLPEESENVAVVLLDTGGGETRACVGFPVANNWVISGPYCVDDRWNDRTKVLAGTNQLSKDVFHDGDAKMVAGIFDHPSSRVSGGSENYILKLFSFAPGYNKTVEMSNATSWDDVAGSCTVTGFGGNGTRVSTVLPAGNVSGCWTGTDACLKETSGAAVVCGGSAVALAVPRGGGPRRSVEFLGRYAQWVTDMTVRRGDVRRTAFESVDDCDVPFWMDTDAKCAARGKMASVAFVLGACLLASL